MGGRWRICAVSIVIVLFLQDFQVNNMEQLLETHCWGAAIYLGHPTQELQFELFRKQTLGQSWMCKFLLGINTKD